MRRLSKRAENAGGGVWRSWEGSTAVGSAVYMLEPDNRSIATIEQLQLQRVNRS